MNQLAKANSLYLQQHAENPVHWMMWSPAAFEKARVEDKPVLVSIGYAACHWCHVMEHESFEDEAIAAYMNEHFICIKVDREEHPDVDHLYMDALTAMTNQGGWPLNMFVTPDKKPFYGGTYFPPVRSYGKPSWMEVLKSLQHFWLENKEELLQQADQLIQHLEQVNKSISLPQEAALVKPELILENLMLQADEVQGGFGNAPKFPSTMAMEYLLVHNHLFPSPSAANHVHFTLRKMIHSGIYDVAGGGLCRYATDNDWMIPHFEKMLYDNALFVSLLSKAFQVNKDPVYAQTIDEILGFCMREWKDASGLYYSATDADSEGVEGKYYIWTKQEIEALIDSEEQALLPYFQITDYGNWEHGQNILHAAMIAAEYCKEHQIEPTYFSKTKQSFLQKIFAERTKRIAPAIDKKMQLSWNALLNIAFADAFEALQNDQYRQEAIQQMDAMLAMFWNGDGLLHLKYSNQEITANADDWAYLIKALIQLTKITQDLKWVQKALLIFEWGHPLFYSEEEKLYYFTSALEKDIIVRKVETYDNATPSVNSVMSANCMMLGLIYKRQDLFEIARIINGKTQELIQRHPLAFGNSAKNTILEHYLKIMQIKGLKEGIDFSEILQEYMPERYILNLSAEKENIFDPSEYFQNNGKLQILECTMLLCKESDMDIINRFEKYC